MQVCVDYEHEFDIVITCSFRLYQIESNLLSQQQARNIVDRSLPSIQKLLLGTKASRQSTRNKNDAQVFCGNRGVTATIAPRACRLHVRQWPKPHHQSSKSTPSAAQFSQDAPPARSTDRWILRSIITCFSDVFQTYFRHLHQKASNFLSAVEASDSSLQFWLSANTLWHIL